MPPSILLCIDLTLDNRYHTGLLNISLLHAAATPVGILAIFSRHAGTPLTVNGSGTSTAVVSVTPFKSTSSAAGGLIIKTGGKRLGIRGMCFVGERRVVWALVARAG